MPNGLIRSNKCPRCAEDILPRPAQSQEEQIGTYRQIDVSGQVKIDQGNFWPRRNTLYTDAVLAQLRSESYPVKPEDEARLSPFGQEHINMLGRYSFSLPEAVARGELRPLSGGRKE